MMKFALLQRITLNHAVHRASVRRRTFTDEKTKSIVVLNTSVADRGFCEGLNR